MADPAALLPPCADSIGVGHGGQSIALHERLASPRCPACHEDLSAGSALPRVRCRTCGVVQHASCVREVGRCATFACPTKISRRAVRPRGEPTRDEPTRDEPTRDEPTRVAPPRPAEPSLASSLAVRSFALAGSLPLAIGATLLLAHVTDFRIMYCPPAAEIVVPFALISALLALVANGVGACLGVRACASEGGDGARLGGLVAAILNAAPWVVAPLAACTA